MKKDYLKYASSLRRNEAKKSDLKKDRINILANKEEFYYLLRKMVLEKDLHLMSTERQKRGKEL